MNNNKMDIDWVHFIRNAELETILKKIPVKKNIKILEIGGGDGFMANKIHQCGYEIISIDEIPKQPQYFPVIVGNATKLNYESEKFDIIFSSHVIAHIDKIELFFTECKRVLKKDGLMIHIVPSTSWSLVTNFWHYILLPKLFIKWKKIKSSDSNINNLYKNNKKENTIKKIINILFLHPLGTNTSFVHEFIYFSKYKWKKLFKNYGFIIIDIKNGPYFYSGHNVFKNKFYRLRKILANKGFAGSFCFILKK